MAPLSLPSSGLFFAPTMSLVFVFRLLGRGRNLILGTNWSLVRGASYDTLRGRAPCTRGNGNLENVGSGYFARDTVSLAHDEISHACADSIESTLEGVVIEGGLRYCSWREGTSGRDQQKVSLLNILS